MSKVRTLVRDLGRLEATTLVVGGIIGTTIFLVTADVARIVGSPFLVLVTWLVAGLLAGTAALCFAELSAAMPKTGGTYVFLERAYRTDLVSFGYAWMMCFAYATGAIAVVAIMAATFLLPVLKQLGLVDGDHVKTIAVTLIFVLTVLNSQGVRQGGITQNVVTALKLSLILAVILIPLLLADWQPVELLNVAYAGTDLPTTLQNIGNGMILCLFSYSGAYFITHVAEEVREPEKNIPRAITMGFGLVVLLYLAINVTYLIVMPFDEVQSSSRIASDTMARVLGPTGAMVTAFAIFCSAVGVLNAQLLNYPRVVFAMAKDGLFFGRIAEIGNKTRAPTNAIVLVGVLSAVYAVSGTYSQILTVVAFVAHVFICLAVAAVIVLRIREPDLERPYKVWGYPFTPIIFIVVSVIYLGNLAVNQTMGAAIGTFVVLAGLPFYWYWKRASLIDRTADHPAEE
jgi:APA family basic amino acid/polyamine antiporter